jgi:hypothetical protein
MRTSRRYFLKQLAGAVSVLLGGTQLLGCLGEDSQQLPTAAPATQSSAAMPATPAPEPTPAEPTQAAPSPTATPANSGPVWQPAPTIEFVEGAPAMVSVRQFVQDPNNDPLVIALKSGALIPGITWNPTNSTIAYDGRPLGAKNETPVVVSGVTFSADDGKI